VLGGTETPPEILAQLRAGFFTGRAVTAAKKNSEMGFDGIVLGVSITPALIA